VRGALPWSACAVLVEKLPARRSKSSCWRKSRITYADVGGLDEQIEAITMQWSCPTAPATVLEYRLLLRREYFCTGLQDVADADPKGRRPNSLAKEGGGDRRDRIRSYILNIKGPELLNKYVGRQSARSALVFQRAREKADEGSLSSSLHEMDSLFRTRGTGISSDIESTIGLSCWRR